MSKITKYIPPGVLIVLFLMGICLQGCSQVRSKTVFPDTGLIEKELKRGVSSEADVEKLLGKSKGYGEAVLPPDHRNHTVRFYERVDVQVLSGSDLQIEQDLLLIFFNEGIYDGHMWYSGLATGRIGKPIK